MNKFQDLPDPEESLQADFDKLTKKLDLSVLKLHRMEAQRDALMEVIRLYVDPTPEVVHKVEMPDLTPQGPRL